MDHCVSGRFAMILALICAWFQITQAFCQNCYLNCSRKLGVYWHGFMLYLVGVLIVPRYCLGVPIHCIAYYHRIFGPNIFVAYEQRWFNIAHRCSRESVVLKAFYDCQCTMDSPQGLSIWFQHCTRINIEIVNIIQGLSESVVLKLNALAESDNRVKPVSFLLCTFGLLWQFPC